MVELHKLEQAEFDEVKARCSRWEEKTLKVAYALLVTDESVSDVAKTYGITKQHAINIRMRFLEKAKKIRLDKFRAKAAPARKSAVLETYASELEQLRLGGYSYDQLSEYLSDQGVTASPTSIRLFFAKREAE